MTMAAGKEGHPLTPLLEVPDLRMEVAHELSPHSLLVHTLPISQKLKSQIWRGGCPPTNLRASVKSAAANCLFLKSQPAGIDTYKLLGRATYCFSNKYQAGIKTTGSEVVRLFFEVSIMYIGLYK